MKNINIGLDDDDYEELLKKKGDRTWKDFLTSIPQRLNISDTIEHRTGEFQIKKAEMLEMRNIGSDIPVDVPVKPNQIMVYTIYTLEKVE